jgi:hypothetical protein
VATKDFEVDGIKVTVTQLTGRKSLRVLHRLLGSLSPSVTLMGKGLGGKKLADADVGKLLETMGADALPRLFEDLPEEKFLSLVDDLVATSVAIGPEGKPVELAKSFDIVFQGRPIAALKLLVEVVRYNYSELFDGGLGGLLRGLVAGKSGSSGSQPSSSTSGPPGGS